MAGKSFDAKAFLINHSEKLVLGSAGLMVLIFLGGSQWSAYKGTPSEITDKVSKSRAALVGHAWPADEQAKYEMTQKKTPKQVVHDHLRNPIAVSQYEMSTRFVSSPWQGKEPLREPSLLTLEDALATSGKVLIELPLDPSSLEGGVPGEDPSAMPGDLPATPETDSEFESSRPNPGGLGGPSALPGGELPGAGHGAAAAMKANVAKGAPAKGAPAAAGHGAPAGGHGAPAAGASYAEYGGMMGGGGTAAQREGQGYVFASVRAVFPLKEQIRRFQEAIHAKTVDIASMSFEVIDFNLERQEQIGRSGNWSDWQPVDTQSAVDVLEKSMAPEPDIVQGTVTNNVITMPLPPRIYGNWRKHGSHPRIDKFVLSPEQVEQEVQYQIKLIELMKDNKKKTEGKPRVKQGGFSGIVGDSRAMQSEVFGGSAYGNSMGSSYGASSNSTNAMMSSMPGSSPAGMGGPRGSGRPAPGAAARGAGSNTNDVMKKLLETDDKDETSKALKQYIEQRVTADGELLLFRYMDFTVESGKTYRYRVRLVLNNPNFGHLASEANGEAPVVEGETRTTEWSNITAPVTLEREVYYFVKDVDPRIGKTKVSVYQWDPKLGTTVSADLDLQPGQHISGDIKTNVIDPAKSTNEESKLYTFTSADVFVDTHADVSLTDKVLHKDLKLPGGSKGDALLPEEALVTQGSTQELAVLDPIRQAAEQKRLDTYQKEQATFFEYLKSTGTAGGDMMMMGSGMPGDEMSNPYAQPKKGANSKGGRSVNPLSGSSMMGGMGMPTGGMSRPPSAKGSGGMSRPTGR